MRIFHPVACKSLLVIVFLLAFSTAHADDVMPGPSLQIDLTKRKLIAFESGKKVKTYRIAVAQDSKKTPTGEMTIDTIVWNPWWYPPKNSDWAKNAKPMPPGPNNPMGAVKMNLTGRYFVHGTNAGKNVRLPPTHGCVRLSNPSVKRLAAWLQKSAVSGYDNKRFQSRLKTEKENVTVALERPVPVTVVR